MTRLAALVVVALVAGCASAWPQNCRDGTTGITCRCDRMRLLVERARDGSPYPAGYFRVVCDGDELPIRADARNVGLPRCLP